MATIPTPLRAALGLAATAIDEARKLPETLPQLPVAVIGTAMQASLRVQQHIAEYAARGDELISQLRGGSDEAPTWATFDEDAGNGGPARAAFELIDEDGAVRADDLPSGTGSDAQPEPATSAESAPTPEPIAVPSRTARSKTAPAKAAPAKKAPATTKSVGKKAPAKDAARPTGSTPDAATKAAPKKPAVHSEPLAQAAARAEPTDRPNPSVLAAEIAQAHPGEAQPGAGE